MIKLSDILQEAMGNVVVIDRKYIPKIAHVRKVLKLKMGKDLSVYKTDGKNVYHNVSDSQIKRFLDRLDRFDVKYKLGESVNESDLGLTLKKGKTITVTHEKSGKEIVIIDKPNVRKEYEKIGFVVKEARTINVEPNWEGMWRFFKQMAKVNPKDWKRMERTLGSDWKKIDAMAKKNKWTESVNEVLTRGGAIELQGQAKYLAQGLKDMTKSYKKKDWAQMEEEVDYIVTKAKLMGDIVKQKRYQESVNEGVLYEAKYKQTYKSITARDKDSRRIWGSQIGHPRVTVRSWSEVGKTGRMKTAYIEVEGDKDWVDAYKKIAFSGKGNFTDVIKSHKESVNEAGTKSVDGEELLKYLQKRFKMSRKQAIASMKKHNMDVSFLKESGIMYRAGVKKYGLEGMKKIQSAAGKGLGHAEIGKIKDKYDKKRKKSESVDEGSMEKNFKWAKGKELKAIEMMIDMEAEGVSAVVKNYKKNPKAFKQFVKDISRMKGMNEEVTKGRGVQKIFDIHKNGYGKLGGKMLDSLSAGLFVQLYDKAPDNIKEKMNGMNEKRLYVVIGKMWEKFGSGVTLR